MTILLTTALLSLMLPLRLKTGLVLLRPFELVIIAAFLLGAGQERWRDIKLPPGLLLLLPFLFWHTASARSVSFENAAREGLQVGVVGIFAFVLAQEARFLNIARAARLLLWGMTAIMAGTIVWHLLHGYWIGWKLVADPRLAFTFLPPLLAGIILFTEPEKRQSLWLAWAGLAPLLLLSGERKALLIYLFLTVLLPARGRLVPIAAGALVAFAALFVLSTVIDDPYLDKQVRTLVDPASTGDYEYVLATGRYRPGDTPSNVQRAFAYAVSRELFAQHPLLGVGTNEYVNIVAQRFPNLSSDLRIGIHGEFLRVLTENGLLGLGAYLLVWLVSWLRLRGVLRRAMRRRLINPVQMRVVPLLFFVPFALFLGTEAPGTRSLVALILISLLPELVRGLLMRRSAAIATSPSTADVSATSLGMLRANLAGRRS